MQDWDIHPKPNDNPLPNDCALVHVAELMADACTKSGREPSPGPKLEGWFRDAGFVDIHHETFRMPLGRWPKEQKMVSYGRTPSSRYVSFGPQDVFCRYDYTFPLGHYFLLLPSPCTPNFTVSSAV
jgi:hypothetical protein